MRASLAWVMCGVRGKSIIFSGIAIKVWGTHPKYGVESYVKKPNHRKIVMKAKSMISENFDISIRYYYVSVLSKAVFAAAASQ